MIEALPPNAAEEALADRVRARRPHWREDSPDPEPRGARGEVGAVDPIAVADEEPGTRPHGVACTS